MSPARGRPPKFGRPGTLVAFTLPNDVLEELRHISPDLGRAIVNLVEKGRRPMPPSRRAVAELISVGARQALVVVDPVRVGSIPGVDMVPYPPNRALLVLRPGTTLADVELA